jgi:hypothetical protein
MTLDELFIRKQRESGDINEHMPALRWLAGTVDSITEFGVRTGCSTAAFLAGKPKKLTSYDINPFTEAALFKQIGKENGTEFNFIQANDLAVDIAPTDMLFIDTVHTYDQLDAELQKHSGKVSKYLIFHDTYGRPTPSSPEMDGMGLWVAILKLLVNGWCIREDFRNQSGLTIIVPRHSY